MMTWIAENIGTIIICAVLIAVVAAIIAGMVRKKLQGRSVVCDCGCCSGCPMSGQCRKNK